MLYTIGYEGVDVQSFIQELKDKGINILIDVRELPLSRKKGFSKSALSTCVASAGIQYMHLRELGAPREVRHKLREGGNWDDYCLGYQAHLDLQGEAMDEVARLANAESVCLMCFEADYRECHRSLIANELQHQGKIDTLAHLTPQINSAAQRAVA